MNRLTASRLGIARECPGFVVPQWVDTPTADTESGKGKHDAQDAAIKRGDVPALYRERWPGYDWRSEQKFAINVKTGAGRLLAAHGTRNYRVATDDEIPGTADVVGLGPRNPDGKRKLVVGDKKQYDPSVPRAAVNAQVHIAALAIARAIGSTEADVFIDHEMRGLDVEPLDSVDFASFHSELIEIAGAVELARKIAADGGPPLMAEGEHCRWCPAYHHCPLKQDLKREVDAKLALVEQQLGTPIPFLDNDDEAARLYDWTERAGMLIKRAKEALYARAKERPIPIRPGVLFGPTTKLGNDKLDGDKLYAIVRDRHGQGIADAAVIRSATKTRLREALDFAGVPSKAAAERELLTELKKRGGISNEEKTVIDEYDVQLELKAGEK